MTATDELRRLLVAGPGDVKHAQITCGGATLDDDAKPCPWCGREMQEGHHDGHVWYRDDSDYIASLKRSIDALQEAHATLGAGECEKLPQLSDSVCMVSRGGMTMEFGYWRCSECGCENFEGAKYCMNCGAKVKDE